MYIKSKNKLTNLNYICQAMIKMPEKMVELAFMIFIYNAENVIFLGPPGVGKSHLAVALCIVTVQSGLS